MSTRAASCIAPRREVSEQGELLRGLPDPTRVAVGHCLELGPDGPPFAPFSAVLRGLAADLGSERLAELAGPGRSDLAGLAPELGPAASDDPVGRGRLFESMATLLERCAADSPLVLVVEDRGRGFDPRDGGSGGLGLVGMHERAALAGGECRVESEPGGGTRVLVRLPLSDEGEDATPEP